MFMAAVCIMVPTTTAVELDKRIADTTFCSLPTAADAIMHLFLPNRSAIHPEESPPIAVPAVYVDAIAPKLNERSAYSW